MNKLINPLFIWFSLILNVILLVLIAQNKIYHLPDTSKTPTPQVFDKVDLASESLGKGDFEEGCFRMLHAINKATNNPDSLMFIWNEISRNINNRPNKDPHLGNLIKAYLVSLESAINNCNTEYDFKNLFELRKRIISDHPGYEFNIPSTDGNVSNKLTHQDKEFLKSIISANINGEITTKNDPPKTNNNPEFELDLLMKDGVKHLKENTLERAELMIQAAIKGLSLQPSIAPVLWEEYKNYLDSSNLESYDKISRLTTYLDNIEGALIACNNRADFNKAWDVRRKILEEKKSSNEKALVLLTKKTVDIEEKIKFKAKGESNLSQIYDALNSETNTFKAIALLDFPSSELNSSQIFSSLRGILDITHTSFQKEITQLQMDLENAVKIDQGEQSGNPTDSEKKPGVYENLLERIKTLGKTYEGSPVESLIEMVNSPGPEGSANTTTKLDTNILPNKFGKLFQDLSEIETKTNQKQLLRYNLWALRTIYGAETSLDWPFEIGQIELTLLHPTVSALYSFTYDNLIKKELDPQTRTRLVQQVLNSKKISLPQF